MDKQTQDLKGITYREIIELRDLMEKFASWQEPLAVLDDFFKFRSGPIDKKRIVREYYARSQLFYVFYEDYQRLIEVGENVVWAMVRAEKIEKIVGFEMDLE